MRWIIISFFKFGVKAGSKNFVPKRVGDTEITALIAIMVLEMVDSHIFDPFDIDFRTKMAIVMQTLVQYYRSK